MKTLGSIESFTGGLFAQKITSSPGASNFFKGAIVTYSNELKNKLGVDTSSGVISARVALEMAQKGKEYLGVDTCVTFTGNAGPTAFDNKPVGVVYIAINDKVYEKIFSGSRSDVREQAVEFALLKLNIRKV